MAAGELTESCARTLCGWTDKIPEDSRDTADAILVAAAIRGMDLRDLAMLAAEITARACPPTMTRGGSSRTGRSGWRPPSAAPGCCPGT
jgi:hypothetical protein